MVNPIARMEIYKFGIVHASSHLSKCPNLDDKMNMYTCIVWHRWLDCSGSHWCQTIPNNTRLGCNHFIFGQVDTWKLPTKILQSFHPYGPIHHVRCHFFLFFSSSFFLPKLDYSWNVLSDFGTIFPLDLRRGQCPPQLRPKPSNNVVQKNNHFWKGGHIFCCPTSFCSRWGDRGQGKPLCRMQ